MHWCGVDIGKNNNTGTVQAESSKFASLLFDQGFQIVIPPRIVANVPEPTVFCIDPIVVYFVNIFQDRYINL